MKDPVDLLFQGISQCVECGFGAGWRDFTSDNIDFGCPNCGSEEPPRLLSDDEAIDVVFALYEDIETEITSPPPPGQMSLNLGI